MNNLKIISLMCLLFTMQAIGQKVGEISEFKSGRAAGNSSENKVKKSPKSIFVNSFQVNYQILYTDWEGTRAGAYTGKTSAELTVGFEGMNEEDYQALTNDLYNKYTADIIANGYELVSIDALEGHKALKKFSLFEGGKPNYKVKDGYISTTPTGFKFYSDDKNKSPLSGKLSGVDAVVVNIVLDIPFMIDSESGASKLATKAVGGVSKIVASPALRISEKSDINFTDPAVLAVINARFNDPVTIDDVFEDDKFKASSAAQTNTSYNLGHITRVYSTDVNTSKVQVAKGDTDKYKKGVSEAMIKLLKAANGHFMSFTK